MRKLTLNVEALAVESFEIDSEDDRGTCFANMGKTGETQCGTCDTYGCGCRVRYSRDGSCDTCDSRCETNAWCD